MIFTTADPDPSWSPALASRRAVLWVGRSWATVLSGQQDLTEWTRLFSVEWAAVYLDAPGFAAEEIRSHGKPAQGRSRLRLLGDDPESVQLAASSIPIYSLLGLDANTRGVPSTPPSGPMATLTRLKMLAKCPSDVVVFALGVDDASSVAQLKEALDLSTHFSRLVVVSTESPNLASIDAKHRVITHWCAGGQELLELVDQVLGGVVGPEAATVRVLGRKGFFSLDIEPCIDRGYPISDRFDVITDHAVRTDYRPSADALEAYMKDPTASWLPYAIRMPYDRHSKYEKVLRSILESFRNQGAAAACTAWIPAEDGAGATTVLRQVCFDIAREGYPVLIARPDVDSFDFKQVTAFLTSASRRAAEAEYVAADLPWVVAFDAQHVQRNWDFVAGLCNGLKKLMRSVVVLGILPRAIERDQQRQHAAGANRELGERLRNSLSAGEASALGHHLNRFLPPKLHRSDSEWSAFLAESNQIDPNLGSRSLFWLALRFWLFRFRPVEGSFRQWFANQLLSVVGSDGELMAALLEIAVLGKYRLPMPRILLHGNASIAVSTVCADESNPLGLRELRYGSVASFTFPHPLIAEELLRIARDHSFSLRAVEKSTCISLLDLELHLFERLFRRSAIGRRECIPMVEDLVTSALRVDERDAPRNFESRERIVGLLEIAPDSLWDASQVFNHHVAKGRRHLAMKPPRGDPSWTEPRIREQLELAENHLVFALANVKPIDDDRAEPPLNLYVSLALTYDARAKKEAEWGNLEVAQEFDRKAEGSYRKAQSIDGDNTYVLENFARFLVYRAEQLAPGEERTRLLVDAITFLEQERAVDRGANRESTVVELLARAFEDLQQGEGVRLLHDMASHGSEAAHIALAQLALLTEEGQAPNESALGEAEEMLGRIPASARTWRSSVLLYRIVSARRAYALSERHELLEDLAPTDFVWPLQLRLERAVLAHQLGNHQDGQRLFGAIRDDLPNRGSPLFIPPELRYLNDPDTGFREPLITTLTVQDAFGVGRNLWGIPEGWDNYRVPFRPYMFNRDVFRAGLEINCIIQFTNFGPQAIPPAEVGLTV